MYTTQEEFNKGYIRMMDSVRDSEFRGSASCKGVECRDCSMEKYCLNHDKVGDSALNAFKVMQIVWDWNQAHPVVTYGTKYKEVFGFDNQIIDCYKPPKTKCPYEMNGKKCSDCNCKFYKDAEYHAPESVNHE